MIHRRNLLQSAAIASAASLAFQIDSMPAAESKSPFPVTFGLNTSTIRGQKLSIEQQIDVTAKAGYDAIEPWMRDIEAFVSGGGRLSELRRRIEDHGIFVASAIGFANWISDDAGEREKGLAQARHDMELVAELGGKAIAAPPVGAHRKGSPSPPLELVADRYRQLCEVGNQVGVRPQLELWGFSPTLSRLGELAFVATEASHPAACVLPDFYHIYKGGNDFDGLAMIEASQMLCFHINDYPADPPLAEIADKHRVFPGDGVCELPRIIRMLIDHGFRGTFSLELFNPDYWQRDAAEVAKEGLAKSRAVVQQAISLA